MREFLQGYGVWVALGVAALVTLLIHALPGHHPCVLRDMTEELKRRTEAQAVGALSQRGTQDDESGEKRI